MSSIISNTVLVILFFAYVDGFCKFPEYFHICGKLGEPTCTHPTTTPSLKWEDCLNNGPGCRCHDGYVRNSQTRTCMLKEKCYGVILVNAIHKTVDSFLNSLLNHHSCK